ncbi:MAG: dihydroxyacetone kinase subunit DhaK [Chloroflexota bacterium]
MSCCRCYSASPAPHLRLRTACHPALAAQILTERGIRVYKSWIGPYATTQEMAGFAISVCKVDDELKALWDAPAIGANVRLVQP